MASAFKALGDNIRNAFEGVGKVIKGALTLDLKKVGEGLTQAVGLGGEDAEKAAAAQSSNTLMDREMEKLMRDHQNGVPPMPPMMMMAMIPGMGMPVAAMSMLGGLRA